MEVYIVVVLFYILTLFLFYKDHQKIGSEASALTRKYLCWSYFALFLGIIARTVYLSYPNDINCDEAMSGYDAWCIAHYQVDQHLMSFPVYFKSWGTGQSALYIYVLAPFVKLFGLSPTVIRVPMAIISSTSLLILYYTLRKTKTDPYLIFLVILFFAFNPWHITKSRWALECNIAPDLIFISTCILALAYYNRHNVKQTLLYVAAFIILALSAYGYAVTWFMLPFYCLFIIVFFYRKKKISIKQIILCLAASLIIAAPLITFAYNIISKGGDIVLGPFTVPALTESRHASTTLNYLYPDLSSKIEYITSVLSKLFYGYDTLTWNSAPYSGQFFNPIGCLFIVVYIIISIKNRKLDILEILFVFILITSIPIILTTEYNVNRWNVIWFPLIFFCIKGIYYCIKGSKIRQNIFYALFALGFMLFSYQYIVFNSMRFNKEFGSHIIHLQDKNVDTIYYKEEDAPHSVIYFYDPINPHELNKTQIPIKEFDPLDNMTRYHAYDKYIVSVPIKLEAKRKTAYIIANDSIPKREINFSDFKIKKGERFTTFWNE